ncbi:MAG: hypothetical protein AAFO79_03320, partial [Pseudomonadota bacterium]
MTTLFMFFSAMLGGFFLGLVPAYSAADVSVQAQLVATIPGRADAGAMASASVHHDAQRKQFLVVNRADLTIDRLVLTTSGEIEQAGSLDLKTHGARLTGVAIGGELTAAIVQPDEATGLGRLVVLGKDDRIVRQVSVGAGPTAVAFTPDGRFILVANEGAPSTDYRIDPEGSVTIVAVADWSVQTVRFDNIVPQVLGSSIHLPSPLDTTIAQDLEPAFVAVSPDGGHAFVTLQENNAVAVVDLETATVTRVIEAGTQDYRQIALDGSDKDGRTALRNAPIAAFRQPAQVASYTVGGQTYLVTTNQGAPRNYAGFMEAKRLSQVRLDPAAFGAVFPPESEAPARGPVSAPGAAQPADGVQASTPALPDSDAARSDGPVIAAGETPSAAAQGGPRAPSIALAGSALRPVNQSVQPAAAGRDVRPTRSDGAPDLIANQTARGPDGGAQAPLAAEPLGPPAPWRAPFQADDVLGRLFISTVRGDYDADGDYDAIYAFGGRSFSIYQMQGDLVFDSGDELARVLSGVFPEWFNSSGTIATFDQRSPLHGVEPYALALGVMAGRTLAFIGLRGMGGVVVYDVTVPQVPRFLEYLVNNRPEGSIQEGTAGDIG